MDNLLGVKIDKVNSGNINSYLVKFSNSKKFNMITPVNPEMLIIARQNPEFKQFLNHSELTTCDGAGMVFAFKLKSNPIKRYPGSLMIYDVLDFAQKNSKKIFFLGAKPITNQTARKKIKIRYPNLKISGYSPPREKRNNRKFERQEHRKIISILKKFRPDILCLFFGAPFQETWFSDNREKLQKLKIKVGISLGGTADFLSGKTKKAPKIFQSLNLEWLYRLTTEKGRFRRFITRIPLFMILSLKEIIFN